MLEFFERNFIFFVVLTIVATFVLYSHHKDKIEREKHERDKPDNKTGINNKKKEV